MRHGLVRWASSGGGLVVAGLVLAVLAVVEALLHARAVPLAGGLADWPLQYVLFVLLALITTLPLAFLHSQPTATAVTISAALLLSLAGFQTLTLAGVCAQLVAGFRLGRGDSRLLAIVLAVVLALPFPLLALANAGMSDSAPVSQPVPANPSVPAHRSTPAPSGAPAGIQLLALLLAVAAPAAALAGIAWRGRREASAGYEARQVVTETLIEHAAMGERARIARELHDVVAHHISMVAVQAETARLTTPGMPAAGAERLSAIGDTARQALTEMRRLLGVLREDAEQEVAVRHPQPGLSLGELNALLDEAREASVCSIMLVLRGAPESLDPGVELAGYRIIQEALTNARRHAPGAAVEVSLHYTGEGLHLQIRDNGPGGPARGSGGLGLTGMRERAAAVGGSLQAGRAPAGGFLVEARLPGRAT